MFKGIICSVIKGWTLWIFLGKVNGLNVSDLHVCWKGSGENKVAHCCFNHYKEDDRCIECKPGTESFSGELCHPCSHNKYGRKCLYTCDCLKYEICDPEFGCIIPRESTPRAEESSNRADETGRKLVTVPVNSQVTPESNLHVLYYMLAAGGIGTWIIFCWTYSRYIYRKTRPIQQNQQDEQQQIQDEQQQIQDEQQQIQEQQQPQRHLLSAGLPPLPKSHRSEHIYDLADESCLDLSDLQRHDHVSTSSGSTSDCFDELSYLSPYNTLQEKRQTKIHDYGDVSLNIQ